MSWSMHEDAVIKLCLSLVVGIVIGLEREMKKKPLGLKTTIIIAVSSCLLTVVSIEASYIYAKEYSRPMDPLRLAAQIVSGVGFLGAGAILRRSNDVISGLTTAAVIWGAAGVGIAIGAGFYIEAITAMILMISTMEVIAPLLKKFGPSSLRQIEMKVRLRIPEQVDVGEIFHTVREHQIDIRSVKIKDVVKESTCQVDIFVNVAQDRFPSEVYKDLRSIPGIQSVEIELLD
ncbi:MgtC/SapB family protein [Bacillus lacus]|uniref:MgtC/SapB family protein n=1 Tax=Metabacillus lacus TaxID=1983721 RepID=A0A7X2LYK2_9BACI|nr:MgtC/SapB family protein [Metabacillus lacus]MRX71933.1 MgtC/SapB family protein [Metabacillus lacus]